ncbi:MAG: GNAT family N-acetyltransferase, partial [Saccharospirillaceae bacterium]|nr:GNAT family N-acetyltransferase [Pseudomonadales bacterium]NRB79839.1 GNAT family N-acetyltransferase [Saccharospirillaceae bacterium]
MTAQSIYYPFKHYRPIIGSNVQLVLANCIQGPQSMDGVPAYVFNVCLNDGVLIGQVDLRIGNSEYLTKYGGQLGYGISKAHRGNNYAFQACSLLKQVALEHAMETIWITCNTDNAASIKTCEKLGAKKIDTVEITAWTELYERGDREKIR